MLMAISLQLNPAKLLRVLHAIPIVKSSKHKHWCKHWQLDHLRTLQSFNNRMLKNLTKFSFKNCVLIIDIFFHDRSN